MNNNGWDVFVSQEVEKSENHDFEEPKYTWSEYVFAWLCVLVGYLICRAFPPSYFPLGNFLVFMLLFAVTAWALVKNGHKLSLKSYISGAAGLVFAAVPVFSGDELSGYGSFVISIIAFCYFVYASSGNCLEKGFSDFIVVDFVNAAALFPIHSFGKLFSVMFSGKKRGIGNALRLALKLCLGLLAGLIPTAVVTVLLAYDEGFSKKIGKICGFFADFDLPSHLGSLLVGVILAMLIFGLYYSSVKHSEEKIRLNSCINTLEKASIVPCITVGAALFPLVAVYMIFFVSQSDYYLSAFSGILPDGFNYADYAREGFFQLCQVSGINLCFLAAVGFFARPKGRADKIFLKLSMVLLSVITLVLIATAMSKMILYIDVYGLTVKRVLASWLMAVLALVFVLAIIKQFVPKLKLVAASVCVVVLMFAVLAFSNYQGIIADYNVDKFLSGDLETIDISTLSDMGENAVPAMVRLGEFYESVLENPETSDKKRDETESAHKFLVAELKIIRTRYVQHGQDERDGVFSFSLPHRRAQARLEEFLKDE